MTEPIRLPRRVASHADADQTLGDTAYIGYVLMQIFKLGIALLKRRWPELG